MRGETNQKVKLNIHIPSDLLKELHKASIESGKSLASIVSEAIEKEIKSINRNE